jgi:hypothetical protein
MLVRSIKVRLVSTSKKPLKSIDMNVIAGTLKRRDINLVVERGLDASAVDKAADAIRGIYRDQGQNVRVEHTVTQVPPGALEVAFEVIQLCTCN